MVMKFFDALVRYEIALWNAVDRELARQHQISLGQLHALRVVDRYDGQARVQDLSDDIGITVGAASKLVDRLERGGLAVRIPNPVDRRSSLISLTVPGRQVLTYCDRRLRRRHGQSPRRRRRRRLDRGPSAVTSPAEYVRRRDMTDTMRAVVVDEPGPPEVLQLRELPVPKARPAQVLIRVKAFGLNRSELHFRQGVATTGTFPRVPGIEATGIVEAAPGGEFAVGAQVVTMMGGMGRALTAVTPSTSPCRPPVTAFDSDLPWEQLGAIPEMLRPRTARSSSACRPARADPAHPRRHVLDGLALAVLAKPGMTVIATTRSERPGLSSSRRRGPRPDRRRTHRGPVRGHRHGWCRRCRRAGRRECLEGHPECGPGRRHVCFTGMLSDHWTITDFYPMDWLPNGVRLTAYSGEAGDLPPTVLQHFLDAVADGTPPSRSAGSTGSTTSSRPTATSRPTPSAARPSS